MLTVCWSPKGGSGTSVVAAAIAMQIADHEECVLVDLGGDQPALLGVDVGDRPGMGEWLQADDDVPVEALRRLEIAVGPQLHLIPAGQPIRRPSASAVERLEIASAVFEARRTPIVIDAGPWTPVDDRRWWPSGAVTATVVRCCYLGLRRVQTGGVVEGDRLIVVEEPGRALRPADVAAAVGEVAVRLAWEPAVARAVDAGLLAHRLPRTLRPLRRVVSISIGRAPGGAA